MAVNLPSLLYHDVLDDAGCRASGFTGEGADLYKLGRGQFLHHLTRLWGICGPPALVTDDCPKSSWQLTFDDGGSSAVDTVTPILEDLGGWKGHFFVTTGYLGTPGFVDGDGVLELARRGHMVGSHSVSHPSVMSQCSDSELQREWRESCDTLAEILGRRIEIASIPGGAYTTRVARAAGDAGIRHLFTSEPVAGAWNVGSVSCLGRFTIWRGMPAEAAVALAQNKGLWIWRQRMSWTIKKGAKRLLGPAYQMMRDHILRRRQLDL